MDETRIQQVRQALDGQEGKGFIQIAYPSDKSGGLYD